MYCIYIFSQYTNTVQNTCTQLHQNLVSGTTVCARWYTAVECTQLLNTVYSCSHWVTLVSSMLFQALSDVTGHSVQLYTADVYRTRYRVVAGTADQSS